MFWKKHTIMCALGLICVLQCPSVKCEPYLVTVQSQDQVSMEDLTRKVDIEVLAGATGPSRVTLGTIEATMSRVVDSDSPFIVTHPPSVPTLALLQDITYDSSAASWTLSYRTEQSDPSYGINHYSRVLYATKAGQAEVGDLHNPCLTQDVSDEDCITSLKNSYVVADALTVGGGDSLTLDTTQVSPDITVAVVDEPNSAVQTLTLTIPHAAIRNHLASEEVTQHPVLGDQRTWRFGIGMIFMGVDQQQSNIVLHDTFNLVEISNQLVTVSKSNSYSIAKHVSFYTQRVVDDPASPADESDIYVAKLEILLNDGHSLETIDTTINEVNVCGLPGKSTMQAAIDGLDNSACISSHPLCEPITYSSETDGVTRTWILLVIPLVDVPVPGEVRISTLMHSIDVSTSPPTRSVSSLNFATSTPPQEACSPVAFETFNPIEHTTAELFRGVGVVAEPIDGYISVHNSTSESISTTDSLLTVVIRPKDAAALAYMSQFPSERIMLDDVYISHALPEAAMPADISNVIHTVNNGRGRLLMDSTLMQACPEEKAGFVYEDGQFTCVTTHDWGLDGAIARPFSKEPPAGPEFLRYFIFEVTNSTEEDAKLWLQENVVGQISASAAAIADSIYTHATSRVTAEYSAQAKVYWMWPVYYWPDQSPVGLKDRAVLSLAWSLAKDPDYTPPSTSRRLLSHGNALKNALKTSPVITLPVIKTISPAVAPKSKHRLLSVPLGKDKVAALERVAHRHGFASLDRARAFNRLETKAQRRHFDKVQEAFGALMASHKKMIDSMLPRHLPPPHLHRASRRPGHAVPV